jgi:type VI secretion system protein ImpK
MTPRFASKIDPIFEHVLTLLERAEDGHDPDPMVEQEAIGKRLADAEAFLGETEEWKLAKFAMVSWIDEILVHGCTWKHGEWWHQNLLEGQHFKVEGTDNFFQVNVAAQEFFNRARQAAGLARKDALEVYYIAVILGFRGIYGQKDLNPQTYGLPGTLPQWLKTTAAAIQLGQGRPPIPRVPRAAHGAKALKGRLEFLGALVWFLLFATVATVLFVMQK